MTKRWSVAEGDPTERGHQVLLDRRGERIAEGLALGYRGADVLEREDHAEEEEEAGEARKPDGGEDVARCLLVGLPTVSFPKVPAVSKP